MIGGFDTDLTEENQLVGEVFWCKNADPNALMF